MNLKGAVLWLKNVLAQCGRSCLYTLIPFSYDQTPPWHHLPICWWIQSLACICDSGLYAVFGDDPPECSVMILVPHTVSRGSGMCPFSPTFSIDSVMCASVWLCVNVYSWWGIVAVGSLSLGRARGGRMQGCFTLSTPNCNYYFLILQYHRYLLYLDLPASFCCLCFFSYIFLCDKLCWINACFILRRTMESHGRKTTDLQAHNPSHHGASQACRSACFGTRLPHMAKYKSGSKVWGSVNMACNHLILFCAKRWGKIM